MTYPYIIFPIDESKIEIDFNDFESKFLEKWNFPNIIPSSEYTIKNGIKKYILKDENNSVLLTLYIPSHKLSLEVHSDENIIFFNFLKWIKTFFPNSNLFVLNDINLDDNFIITEKGIDSQKFPSNTPKKPNSLVLSEKDDSVYKTYKGISYTKDEWEAYEKEQ